MKLTNDEIKSSICQPGLASNGNQSATKGRPISCSLRIEYRQAT
jgi:hypothetical protein